MWNIYSALQENGGEYSRKVKDMMTIHIEAELITTVLSLIQLHPHSLENILYK